MCSAPIGGLLPCAAYCVVGPVLVGCPFLCVCAFDGFLLWVRIAYACPTIASPCNRCACKWKLTAAGTQRAHQKRWLHELRKHSCWSLSLLSACAAATKRRKGGNRSSSTTSRKPHNAVRVPPGKHTQQHPQVPTMTFEAAEPATSGNNYTISGGIPPLLHFFVTRCRQTRHGHDHQTSHLPRPPEPRNLLRCCVRSVFSLYGHSYRSSAIYSCTIRTKWSRCHQAHDKRAHNSIPH